MVAEYDERSLTGAPPLPDLIAGFGPLQRYLDDPDVEELWINEPGKLFVARSGQPELTTTHASTGRSTSASSSGVFLDAAVVAGLNIFVSGAPTPARPRCPTA